jgi:hypothetical protein
MAPPAGVNATRWSNTVARVAQRRSWTTAQADTYLSRVWSRRRMALRERDDSGDGTAFDALREWLAERVTGRGTLARALEAYFQWSG